MTQDLKENLTRAREMFLEPDDQKMLDEMEKSIRRDIAQSGLRSDPLIGRIIEEAQNKVSAINTLLTYDEELTDLQRKSLFKERSVYQFWIDRFVGPDVSKKMESISKFLDRKVNDK